jgi:hypothetical protein
MPSKSCHFARAGGFLCKQEVTGSIPVGSTREVPGDTAFSRPTAQLIPVRVLPSHQLWSSNGSGRSAYKRHSAPSGSVPDPGPSSAPDPTSPAPAATSAAQWVETASSLLGASPVDLKPFGRSHPRWLNRPPRRAEPRRLFSQRRTSLAADELTIGHGEDS